MDKLVADYLRPWKDALPAIYDWSFDHDRAALEFGLSFEGANSFERTLELKSGLRDLVRETDCQAEHARVAAYFIKVWGGITRFSKIDETLGRFHNLKGSMIPPENYTPPFQMISSWSKWASIICPDWACIYDARVAYSLNAINHLGGAEYSIFPVPEGRNSRLKMLDVSTLLLSKKLRGSKSSTRADSDPRAIRKNHFIPERTAYAVSYTHLTLPTNREV